MGSLLFRKVAKSSEAFLDILEYFRCSEAFQGVLIVLSGSEMFPKVLSRSLTFWGAVVFLGFVMVCIFCEWSLNFLRHSHGF